MKKKSSTEKMPPPDVSVDRPGVQFLSSCCYGRALLIVGGFTSVQVVLDNVRKDWTSQEEKTIT